MDILKFLSKEEKQRILNYKNNNLNNITFGNDDTEMFFKWILYSSIYPSFTHIIGKEVRLSDGLFFTGKSKNGVKPSKLFPYNFDVFSLSKMDVTWEILKGKDILKGYNSKTATIKSCMTFGSTNTLNYKKLNFYTNNKNISLLVIKEKNKIVGRTVLWKSGNNIYHDKFYYYNPLFSYLLKMICTIKNFHSVDYNIKVKLNYIPKINLTFGGKKYSFFNSEKIPYLDNMLFFNKKTKELNMNGNGIDLTEVGVLSDYIKEFSI